MSDSLSASQAKHPNLRIPSRLWRDVGAPVMRMLADADYDCHLICTHPLYYDSLGEWGRVASHTPTNKSMRILLA